jgi:serine/threonine-protein kinase
VTTPDSPAEQDPLVGTVIAERYRVDARLGDGGMGTVYRVEHTHMRKRLALKVLHRELSASAEVVARFEREAMAAANIEHPNVANATDFGKLPDGSFYLVLEYIEGIDLRQLMSLEKWLPPARAVHIALQILGALGRAHELGIVHRDLKPENVLLVEKDGDSEFVKILDFGIARVPVGTLGSIKSSSDMRPLTKAGTVYGTPEYMAPEQALGHQVDGRADLYAVGILLFEMLTGHRPYDDKDKIALLGAHVSKPIPDLRVRAPKGQSLPEGLVRVVERCLAKAPEDRFESAREVAQELLDLGYEAPMPITRHPTGSADRSGAFAGESSSQARKIAIEEIERAALEAKENDPGRVIVSPPAGARAYEPRSRRGAVVPWIIAVASLAVAAGTFVVLRRPPRDEQAIAPRPEPSVATVASSAAPAPAKTSETRGEALRALGRIASGEVEEGLRDLDALVAENPQDQVLLRTAAQGYARARKAKTAIATLRQLAALSREAAVDPILTTVYEDALADAQADDDAVALLATGVGPAGPKLLYTIAFGDKTPSAARGRALRALRDPKLAGAIGPEIRAAVDLRLSTTCPARKAVVDKHRKIFDATALPILVAMAKPTCGPDKKRDCWPCIKDLDEVVKEVEARATP